MVSRTKHCRICVWSGVALSALLHGVVAAALLQLTPSGPHTSPERTVDLDLAMFVGGSELTAEAAADVAPNAQPATPTPTVAIDAGRESEDRPAHDTVMASAPKTLTPKATAPRGPEPVPAAASATKTLRNNIAPPAKPTPKPPPSATPKPTPPKQATQPASARAATAPDTRPKSSPPAAKPAPARPRGSESNALNQRADRLSSVSQAAKISAEQAYLAALQRAISRQQRYPASAKRRQQTGIATLAFVIQADGRIGQIHLAKGSGHQALDQAALDALYRLGRFKPIPSTIARSTWTLRVPIRFDLQ